MALSLKQFSRPENREKIITIVGEGGVGKTSLAALFPDPVIIRIEDGVTTDMENVVCSPVIKTSAEIFECIAALKTENHQRKTVIFDSITQANLIFEKEIVAGDPKNPASINQAQGGYGNGHGAVSALHQALREHAGDLSLSRNMHVIFIAHAEGMTIDPADSDPFLQYTLRLNKRSISPYVDNVDAVAFIKLARTLKSSSKENGPKKALGDGSRIISCYSSPAQVSKNRFRIKADLPFIEGTNPFAPFLEIPSETPKTTEEQST
jgi:hypothetical protein